MPDPDLNDDSSASDLDFAPGIKRPRRADRRSSASSSSDSSVDDAPNSSPLRKRRRTPAIPTAPDLGLDNSGDEAIIATGRRRRRNVRANTNTGAVKTRSMRAAQERAAPTASVPGSASLDVEALWTQMQVGEVAATARAPDGDAEIRIRHAYNFAGRVHVEEKVVARESAEALLYDGVAATDAETVAVVRPPLRRAFRSAFEPAPPPAERADLDLGVGARERARQTAATTAARRINTVEKSRIDWAGFVDREGIRHDLDVAGRSKDAYNRREEFLDRTNVLIDEARKTATMRRPEDSTPKSLLSPS